MKNVFRADEWQHEAGSDEALLFDLGHAEVFVSAVFRSLGMITVEAVDSDGQLFPIEVSTVVELDRKLVGFSALRVQCSSPFVWRLDRKPLRLSERLDPTPLVVSLDSAARDEATAMKLEIAAQLRRMQLDGHFRSDEAVMELIDDLQRGDLEFFEEEDDFGSGHMEMEEDFPGGASLGATPLEEPIPATEGSEPTSSEPKAGKKKKSSAAEPSSEEDA